MGDDRLVRSDHAMILSKVPRGARVLDIGCGDGTLLKLLEERLDVDGRGIELSQSKVNACLSKGLSVIQGNADEDLDTYPSDSFDVIILSQTLQAMQRPRQVVEHMLRIGREGFVSFPNFAHWKVRMFLLLSGRMPMTQELPVPWYLTQNIHLCTIRDFQELLTEMNIHISDIAALHRFGALCHRTPFLRSSVWFKNVFAEEVLFHIHR